MIIVHATSVHRADDGRIFERQCRSLAGRGHSVYLLAPDAPEGLVDGVRVVSIGGVDRRVDRMWRLVNEIGRRIRSLRPDVVVLHDPELLRLVPRLRLGRVRPAVVYDAHEDYAAQVRDKEWLPTPVRRPAAAALGVLERLAARHTAQVLTATPAIARRFPAASTAVVLNRPLLADFPGVDAVSSSPGDHPAQLVYVGDLREVRGARPLVDAVEQLARHRPVRLSILGKVTPAALLGELQQHPGWAHVDLAGWRPRDEVYARLATADVAVLPFLSAANHTESQPNKLFEYLLMGVPIVATDFPLWRGLADAVGGRLEPSVSGDGSSIAAAVERIVLDPPESAERAAAAARARAAYTWESIEDAYVAVIEASVAPRRSARP